MNRLYRIVDNDGNVLIEHDDKKLIQYIFESIKHYFGNDKTFKIIAIGKSTEN
jgi:hypothetical protein